MNHVSLIGRLTKDNMMKITPSGKSVLAFTLAVNRRVAKDAEQQADFINCVAWGKTAELMGTYTKKGSLIGVHGRISTRNYEDQNGKKVYITEVVADEVTFLEKKKESEQQGTEEKEDYSGFETGPTLDIASDDLPF